MYAILIIFSLFGLYGCGDDISHHPERVEVKTVTNIKAQDFEGHFYFANGGYIKLTADADDRVRFETSGQILTSVNPKNGTLGEHPRISDYNVQVSDGKLRLLNKNYSYSSSTHDLEEDVSGGNITGAKRTDIEVSLLEDGRIRINIKIYSGPAGQNINNVIANRNMESL